MAMPTEAAHLQLVQTWFSPAFPIGSFAYSHGLEWAIVEGDLRAAFAIEAWIATLVEQGSVWNDAVLMAQVWQDDSPALAELALALAASQERALETAHLGQNFLRAAAVFTADAAAGAEPIAYPIAAGRCCHAMGMACETAVLAYLTSVVQSLVSVAVRLVPLGQSQGLQVIRQLFPVVTTAARRAATATLDDLGSSCLWSDVAAMRHETQTVRIFRT
jgi:urease accessory protein